MQLLASAVFCSFALAANAKTDTASWACPLKSCVLNSTLASAGPGFNDIVRFNSMTAQQKNGQQQCPFGGDDGKAATKKEWKKYMKELDVVGSMSPEERRAWAIREAAKLEANLDKIEEPDFIGKPAVNVSDPGIEALNRTTYSQIRNENKYDLLVTFYAPWCPHCKAFVTDENAPIKALAASLEKAKGPKVVTFDITASDPPEALGLTAVPTIFLIKTTGEAILFKQNPGDIKLLMAFALGDDSSNSTSLIEKPIARHLRA